MSGTQKPELLYALLERMQKIASKKVRHYYEDFSDYDVPDLKKMAKESDKLHRLFWIVRECGTNLGYVNRLYEKDSTYYVFTYYMDNAENDFYEVDVENGTIKKIPFEKRSEFLRSMILQYRK